MEKMQKLYGVDAIERQVAPERNSFTIFELLKWLNIRGIKPENASKDLVKYIKLDDGRVMVVARDNAKMGVNEHATALLRELNGEDSEEVLGDALVSDDNLLP